MANTPLDRLWRPGVHAAMFHRLTLGRRLEEVYTDGGDRWLSELALAVGAHAGIAQRFHPLDPTRCALTGDAIPDRDEHTIALTPGAAKAHRPDGTQAL